MKEYIEREAAKKALCDVCEWEKTAMCRNCINGNHPLDKIPAADVVEVVWCGECKWYGRGCCHNPRYGDGWANYPAPCVNKEYYCADGERREEEQK